MRMVDRLLQAWRGRMARPWVPPGAMVLDIGCHHGEFLRSLGNRIGPSIGLDPRALPDGSSHHRLIPQLFTEPLEFPDNSFDAVVLLATLEHIQDKDPLGRESYRLLRPGGRVIITVPSPRVDRILTAVCRLRLADGMCLEEHYGFDPRTTPQHFIRHGFILEHSCSFQLGLNHLFVFRKPSLLVRRNLWEEACPVAFQPSGFVGTLRWRWQNFWHPSDLIAHRLEPLFNDGYPQQPSPAHPRLKFVEDVKSWAWARGPISAHSTYWTNPRVLRRISEHVADVLVALP